MTTDPNCIFCKILAGEIPSEKVYEDETVYAFRDINPKAPTHVLVIPREHRARLSDYGMADREILGHLLAAANVIAAQEGLEDYRTVVNCGPGGGQEVYHLHLHLLGGRQMSGELG